MRSIPICLLAAASLAAAAAQAQPAAPAAKPPEQLTTAVTTKAVGKAKAPIKCADGVRVKPGAKACENRRGVDTATLAAEAQPGEVAPPPAGQAPVTNALPSGDLKTK
jgi:hypothetical protein